LAQGSSTTDQVERPQKRAKNANIKEATTLPETCHGKQF